MRAARPLLVLLTVTWIALLLGAAAAALNPYLSAAVYALGSLICHQRPDRSFHLAAAQLPVCARCFGLYVGAAAGAIAALKGCATRTWWRGPSGLRSGRYPVLRIVLVAAVPTAITWSAEVVRLWSPSNLTRFAAALPLGVAMALTVNYRECARLPRTGSTPPRMSI